MKNPFQIHTNGRMRSHVMPDGSGGLFHDWVALTRYSENKPQACGPRFYLREGDHWFRAGEAMENLDLTLQVTVLPETDAEIRKITLSNSSDKTRQIELTTYAEISLNHPMGDAGHPAFSKLFVQTSVAQAAEVLLARRRPRGMNEKWPWMAQTLVAESTEKSWETNRARFIGRGRSPQDPAAMDRPGALSGETGNVLDPVMAWRCPLTLEAGGSRTVWLVTAAAISEEEVLEIIQQVSAASSLAQIRFGPLPQNCKLPVEELLTVRKDRIAPTSLEGADILHRFPLSGEEIRVIATAGWKSPATREVLTAMNSWRALGLKVRLYIMDAAAEAPLPDGVFQVDPTSFSAAQMEWWLASAQCLIGEQLPTREQPAVSLKNARPHPAPDAKADPGETLTHFNGHGGFTADGREYVIPLDLANGLLNLPPMPWVNVLANPDFGCIVTERGAGYTWSRNSQANRLTPWSNDPIRDPHGESILLCDEETGLIWSPLPGPAAPQSSFVVRHGFGYSRFLSNVTGIFQTVEFLVPPEDPVKLVSVRLENRTRTRRKLAMTTCQRLLLCSTPDRHHATLAWTDENGLQHAANPRAGDFAGGRVFSFVTSHGVDTLADFCNNSILALEEDRWENARGFGTDACFSRKIVFDLPPESHVEFSIVLGEAMSESAEQQLVSRYQKPGAMLEARENTRNHWQKILGHVKIKTPLPEVDLMVNGWLIYQNLACRIWGRSAFYQSGGAYGFRDQLQDSAALASTHPELMRSQILLHSAQQFPEGDVTHWWHPEPMARGMRTKFSDDLLWLPYLTGHYVHVTGDSGVFEETVPFIEGPLLGPLEDEEYMKPMASKRSATIFEHCCLAIDRSLTKGEHGLPLMGIGDWNDGMSRIGREGSGESVWMGFFLITILRDWIPLCQSRGETLRAGVYAEYLQEMLVAVNEAGWDGDWYRRAYYDDGTPLGTHSDDECRIDALAQAWAVISNAAPPERAEQCLDSLERELIDPKQGLVRLLHPPFVNTPHDPGYIKGYVAGVRENGGQYTHAACWVIRAMAEAGRRDTAAELLQRLSPVWQSRNAKTVATYQVEPYVVAADIYGAPPHVCRGGWTWYTGSAGWMFRVTVESILGLKVENGDTLVLDPRIPDDWPGFSIDFKTTSGLTDYRIEVFVTNGSAARVTTVTLDGNTVEPVHGTARWPMLDDRKLHRVQILLGPMIF
jgi:cellobiose phosphorylase